MSATKSDEAPDRVRGGLNRFALQTELLGNNSVLDPPDPIPNSEVKRNCADDSVGSPHVKVGHCQAFNFKTPVATRPGFFLGRKLVRAYFPMQKVAMLKNVRQRPRGGLVQAFIPKSCTSNTGIYYFQLNTALLPDSVFSIEFRFIFH